MRVRLALLFILSLPPVAFAQSKQESYSLDRMVVTGKRPTAAEDEGPDGIRTYDETEIEASGAFSLSEFLETLPQGGDDEQLILVDGVPTPLSGLTPAMIASIEVSYSGAMPQYGAYSRGRIINIRTKQEYNGGEIGLQVTGSLRADAWRRELTFTGGSIRAPWRMMYSAVYERNDAVTADERSFSRGQDNRARGGRDFRLPWGDPAVVQAVAGNLNDVFNSSGNPVPVALVPDNASGPLLPGQFIAGTGPAASGQRFFNTSPYLYLQSPSETLGANFNLMRSFKKLQLGFTATHGMNRNRREGPPPVSVASAATLVPAALNPFGQDVMVGLVHTGFGPVIQESNGNNSRVSLSAGWSGGSGGGGEGPASVVGPGVFLGGGPNVWRVFAHLSFNRSQSENDTRDLDPAALTAALASANPATRFNPFVGAGSLANAALYPSLAIQRTQENANHSTQLQTRAFGPLAAGWGAGPIRVTFNGNASWRQDERTSRNLRGVADGTTRNYDANYRLVSSLDAPLLKDRPAFYRFEGSATAAYSFNSRGGDTRRGGVGVFWAPARAFSIRATFNQNTSSPGEQGEEDPEATVETLMDPRRTPAAAENVQVLSRRSATTQASRGDDMQMRMTFMPPFRPGLQFMVSYRHRRSSRATGNPFRPQDVIDNEALFAGRVIREAPTPADILLGQPGRILVVDTTASAVASNRQGTLDYGVEYKWPASVANRPAAAGAAGARGSGTVVGRGTGGLAAGQARGARPVNRFTISLDGEVPLVSRYELAEGQAFVSRESGPANRPDWTARAQLRWNNRRWNAGLNLRHNAASRLGTIPPITSAGFDVGYQFEQPFWGKFGKNLRVRLALQNVGRDAPPYADTILGYRGGSAVGTTMSLSVNSPW